jgi:hypothetical protein
VADRIFEAIAILEIGDLFVSVVNRNDQPVQVWSWDKGRGKNQMRLENVHFVSLDSSGFGRRSFTRKTETERVQADTNSGGNPPSSEGGTLRTDVTSFKSAAIRNVLRIWRLRWRADWNRDPTQCGFASTVTDTAAVPVLCGKYIRRWPTCTKL